MRESHESVSPSQKKMLPHATSARGHLPTRENLTEQAFHNDEGMHNNHLDEETYKISRMSLMREERGDICTAKGN